MGGFKEDLYVDASGRGCKTSTAWAEDPPKEEILREDAETSQNDGAPPRPTLRRHLVGGLARLTRNFTFGGAPTQTYLDKVLGQEFSGAADMDSCHDDEVGVDEDTRASGCSSERPNSSERRPSVTSEGIREFSSQTAAMKSRGARIVEQRWFTAFFIALTFYALYVPDLDLWLGTRESRFAISITTTVASFFFLIEIILHVIGKADYACRPYFWLDLVSLISLLPDTYLMEAVVSGNSFVAGRSSRLMKVLFLARSSRAARLNRLGRIIRVVAMLSRVQRLWGHGAQDINTDRLLAKKLQRIFHFLDEDMDGYVAREHAERCLSKIRTLSCIDRARVSWAGQMARNFSGSVRMRSPSITGDILRCTANGGGSPKSPSSAVVPSNYYEDGDAVNLETFRSMVQEDPAIVAGLRKACKEHIQQSNNMANVTSRSSEYLGVKIALFVILLLLIIGFIMNSSEDLSGEYGLASIDRLVRLRLPAAAVGSPVPLLVQDQVREWIRGDPDWRPEARKLLYLDLNRRVYCNDFGSAVARCALHNSSELVWSTRESMAAIDDDLYASHYRVQDMVLIRVPDLSDHDISTEEFERRTTSVAVIDGRSAIQVAARTSVLTTSSVIVIIVVGVALVTRDLGSLNKTLLKPLVELADEMDSASRLQLAGLSDIDEAYHEQGPSEIRLIRKIFENMKKAIKNWGKYVPWQVVQALLRKDTEANIEVKEMEVSIFFSDIANFTSIVEGLPPEKSLLLLSRYFHDMSKIMDEYGGIVIEFIGDAILGIYGAPVANEEHPTSALKSALHMIRQLDVINKWLAERSLPPVQIRAGLHTGRALVGNMGFQSRMKYGIVGEESEIASRLEEMNKTYSSKLLISQEMCRRLVPDVFVLRPVDYVHLGSEQSTLVYEVLERNHQDKRSERSLMACSLCTVAVELYRSRSFVEAAEKFEEARKLMEKLRGVEDCPTVLMIRRCRSYAESPPGPDWDGVWDRGDLP